MDEAILKRISDPVITEEKLRSELHVLGDVTEPSSFWLKIANDTGYSFIHRALSICQFFKRHIATPVSLNKLAEMLDKPGWINAHTVTIVTNIKGEMPVQWNIGEQIITVHLFPGTDQQPSILYLRLSEKLGIDAFLGIITADPTYKEAGDQILLLEAACS